MRPTDRALLRVDSTHLLMLKGLLIWAVVLVAAVAAWHYGLLQRVWQDDATGLSVAISLVFLASVVTGSGQLLGLSRALNHVGEIEKVFRQGPRTGPTDGPNSPLLPEGCVAGHIQGLRTKAVLGGPTVRLDQTLLLDSFEAELRRGHEFGWFVADLLLSLGLLGTVIGFIIMLGPVSALGDADHGAVKSVLGAMSGGMAVALYTTLTGLIGGMLLKVQGFMLDGAVAELVHRTTALTEIYVIPAIERTRRHAPA